MNKKQTRMSNSRQNTQGMVLKQASMPANLKSLLRRFKKLKFEYVQCGRIHAVADGIARVYGLDGVQAGELLEFVTAFGSTVRGMALNLEKECARSSLDHRQSPQRAVSCSRLGTDAGSPLRVGNRYTSLRVGPILAMRSPGLPDNSWGNGFHVISKISDSSCSNSSKLLLRRAYAGMSHLASAQNNSHRYYPKMSSETKSDVLGIFANGTPNSVPVGEPRETPPTDMGVAENVAASEVIIYNNKDFYENMVSVSRLKIAWTQLKSNPGMMTPGATPETLNKISEKWFVKTSEALLKNQYQYPMRRRIQIPKPKAKEGTRPLTIANPRVKIIERAILNAIEPHFEGIWNWEEISKQRWESIYTDPHFPKNDVKRNSKGYYKKSWVLPIVFRPCSHGFRPGRGAHGALKSIREWRTNTVWMLDYDIKKAFDSVNRRRLRNLFLQTLDQPKVWAEIEKMMNAKVIQLDEIYSEDKGTAQGSILSPFLFNVYMNHFDGFMQDLISRSGIPKGGLNPEARRNYGRIASEFSTRRLHTAFKKYGSVEATEAALRREKKEHYDKYGGRAHGIDVEGRKIQYVRYADDFLIGIVGPKNFAENVRDEVDRFIKGDLHLEIKKNELINRNTKGVTFLGYNIRLSAINKKTQTNWKRLRALSKYKIRVIERFRGSDARLANGAVAAAKCALLKAFNRKLNNSNGSWSPEDINAAADSMVVGLDNNPALSRWSDHFADLRNKNIALALNYYKNRCLELPLPDPDGDLGDLQDLKHARDAFIEKIDAIYSRKKSSWLEERRSNALEKFEARKDNPRSAWSSMKETDVLRMSHMLSNVFLDQRKPRQVSLYAPLKDITNRLRVQGYLHPTQNRVCSNGYLVTLSDADIVLGYSALMHGLLSYYRAADNFTRIKSLVSKLRSGCLLTLARKHKKKVNWAYSIYGEDASVILPDVGRKVKLPSAAYISGLGTKFLLGDANAVKVFNLETITRKFMKRQNISSVYFSRCSVVGCTNSEIEIHHIRKLERVNHSDGSRSILTRKGSRIKGLPAVLTAMSRKQLPLCKTHHLEFEKGVYRPIDTEYLRNSLNINSPESDQLRNAFLQGQLGPKNSS